MYQEEPKPKPITKGKRDLIIEYLCTIDISTGVTVDIYDPILSYDIYNDDNCIASFSNDIDFANYVFNLPTGTYSIYLHTNDNLYIGHITL